MRFVCSITTAAATMAVCWAQAGGPVKTELTRVEARPLAGSKVVVGELAPYQGVDIFARVTGFVEKVLVDRGSRVRKGERLATMSAPDLKARRLEAEARIPELAARKVEAQAKVAAAESTYQRLREAAKTPGVVAGNDVVLAGKSVEAAQAQVAAIEQSITAARAAVQSIVTLEDYLVIDAPFDGVITDRFTHPGMLAGPEGAQKTPLFHLEQVDRLRLVAAVPEAQVSTIRKGMRVPFATPAYPGETFTGVVARPAFAVDRSTRTMPVELDVANASGRLSPGMYTEVQWPMRGAGQSLFVPRSAIKETTERIFVIRVHRGLAEWVDVRRGAIEGKDVEVFGELKPGDPIVLRATDEIRPGTPVGPP